MNAMTNQETDTALILENELQRRTKEIVERVVVNMVGKIIHEELNKYKNETVMEIALSVGKMFKVIEQEGRKPLWESTPEEFAHLKKDQNHAIRKQA